MASETVAIITSGAYVGSELSAEFGRLPPSFLPFGHERVFMKQVASLESVAQRVLITLPSSFELPEWDAAWLDERGVEVLRMDEGLSLGESVSIALAILGEVESIAILHGDTLFIEPLPAEVDIVSMHEALDNYEWGSIEDTDAVLSGYFAFSSANDLLRSIIFCGGDFVKGVRRYSETQQVLEPKFVKGWLDFGHLQNYYQARSRVRTTRSFNSLDISNRAVLKSSSDVRKVGAEADWFENLPPRLRLHTPHYLGRADGGYRLAYENSPTLHELFVFGELSPATWRKIVAGCFEFLDGCSRIEPEAPPADLFEALIRKKTVERLADWSASDNGVDLDLEWKSGGRPVPSLRNIAEECTRVALESSPISEVMHGDFCFTNIFFDFRSQCVKVIDPRGATQPDLSGMFGDLRYDLAKINHSIEGYDYILSNRYRLLRPSERDVCIEFAPDQVSLVEEASVHELHGHRLTDPHVVASTILLFLSMLPLHADRPDRQIAFIANALRLFEKMVALR